MERRVAEGTNLQFMYLRRDSIFFDNQITYFIHDYQKNDSVLAQNRFVKTSCFASPTEISNRQYNKFLDYLLKVDSVTLYQKCKPDNDAWTRMDVTKDFYIDLAKSYHSDEKYLDFPLVNIS